MQPSTAMMSYQNPHVTDKAVLIVTSIRPPTTTTTGQRLMCVVALITGMMLGAGMTLGAVWMSEGGSSHNHLSGSFDTAEGLVLGTPKKCNKCVETPKGLLCITKGEQDDYQYEHAEENQ